jgi:hypothetical protein
MPESGVLLTAGVWAWLVLGLGLGVGAAQNVSEQYLLLAANQERASHGLGPLRIDLQLQEAARQHAIMMANHHDISHQFAGEADLAERGGLAGAHFSRITENVGEGSNSALLHRLWMQSAGHRANLLDAAVDAVGIAVVADRGQLYAVEDFAHTVQPLTLEQQEATVASLLADRGVAVVGATTDARATCALDDGYAGRQPGFVMRFTASNLGQLPAGLTERLASGRYREAQVGACRDARQRAFTSYRLAVLLFY